MIKAHPTDEMLRAFAADQLPVPLAVGVAAHCELCAACRNRVHQHETELAAEAFDEPLPAAFDDAGMSDMLDQILASPAERVPAPPATQGWIEVDGERIALPGVLARHHQPTWRQLGKVRHQGLAFGQAAIRASLLHIAAGGQIPEHTHRGYELTLLLSGSMQDGGVRYQRGDFIWRDASVVHTPHTAEGCLCYTVQDAPIHFTRGLPRLLNPLAHRLY